jgi:hypothetical protein
MGHAPSALMKLAERIADTIAYVDKSRFVVFGDIRADGVNR